MLTTRNLTVTVLQAVSAVFLTACATPHDTPVAVLDSVVRWSGHIELQEPPGVVNVWPMVRIDPRGGFLIADLQEGQIRRYDADGGLRARFGTRGSGPQQFKFPSSVVRLPSGEILAVDRDLKFSILDSSGAYLERTIDTPLAGVDETLVLDDSTLLLSGTFKDTDLTSPRLHLWDVNRAQIRRSFFRPYASCANKELAAASGWVRAAVWGDTIVATFAPNDTLYFFNRRGDWIRSVPLPPSHFRPAKRMPIAARLSVEARSKWLSGLDLVASVYWAGPGKLIVPYESIQGAHPRWSLLAMNTRGGLLFDVPEAPRLLTADSLGNRLVFVDPGSRAPDRIAIGAIRGENGR